MRVRRVGVFENRGRLLENIKATIGNIREVGVAGVIRQRIAAKQEVFQLTPEPQTTVPEQLTPTVSEKQTAPRTGKKKIRGL